MIPQRAARSALVLGALLVLLVPGSAGRAEQAQGTGQKPQTGKPQVRLRANPQFGYPPLRVVFTAELQGGADDHEEFYCAKVEWEWGDGSTSSFAYDCDPYEAGKSEIRRRFIADHTYNNPGRVDAVFRLKQGSRVVGSARTPVTISNLLAGLLASGPLPSLSRQ